jgi:PII-like signaling protein
VLPEVTAIKHHGLITLERARMLTGELAAVRLPEELHEATKLTLYLGRQEKVYGMPAHAAVCDLMYRHELAGASVFLGVDGTVDGVRERAQFVGRNARVPMMLISVGSGEAIARVLPELNALVRHPIVTLERVRVCKRDGERLAEPHALPGTDEHGRPIWQKLMVYASEQAKHGGRPVYQELVRRLRETGAAGATTLRGIWGFHGDHAPHGDRFFSLRRQVPTVTILVDEPDRIAAAFEIVDELTDEQGLVTSEMVPALASLAEREQRGRLQLARHRF